jgi:hypothetical protein
MRLRLKDLAVLLATNGRELDRSGQKRIRPLRSNFNATALSHNDFRHRANKCMGLALLATESSRFLSGLHHNKDVP